MKKSQIIINNPNAAYRTFITNKHLYNMFSDFQYKYIRNVVAPTTIDFNNATKLALLDMLKIEMI
jgi:hypothetical protein